MKTLFHSLVAACMAVGSFHVPASTFGADAEVPPKPNFLFILCDDLGYGDLQCLNAEGKIPTPNFNRLAREGVIFTDAHSSSSVCTPTRYGVLTGRYNWRSKLQSSVLGGLSPRLIEKDRMTVASFLKKAGCHTACIGKWHLGMDWALKGGAAVNELSIESPDQVWNVDFSKPILNGPNSVGFDYYYGISASLDMVPYTYIENDHVAALPDEEGEFLMMEGKEGRFTRKGPRAASFDAANVLPDLTAKAITYIKERAEDAKKGQPFFLYLPYASPHTPILPMSDWQGKSGLNAYGDFVMQNDDCVGQLLATLDELGLAENTMVVFTSDNGCSPQAQYQELLPKGHNPSHVFRGHKADIYDGGHRVPFIVRWPARVKGGATSKRLVCLTDFMATAADVIGEALPATAAEDSFSFLPVLTGKASGPKRDVIVHHSINGSFAIRQGRWKLNLCPGSGGWSAPRPGKDDLSGLPPVQLYDLSADIGETKNLQAEQPKVVARLTQLLERYVAEGRSTPGKRQANAVEVQIFKEIPAPSGKKKKS